MNDWGWQDSGPAGNFVSSAPVGGIQAEILRRQNMRLNPAVGNPFQISPQQRAGIISQQMEAGTYNGGGGNSSTNGFKNSGMVQNPMQNALNNVQMQPNNGRPVGAEFAHGVQMNPIMGGVGNIAPSQVGGGLPVSVLGPGSWGQQTNSPSVAAGGTGSNYAWNDAFRRLNNMPIDHKTNQAADENYLRTVLGTKPQYKMPNMQQGMQQGGQQQLMMLLQQLLGRG